MPRAWHHSRIWTFTQNYDIAMGCELLISWINIFFIPVTSKNWYLYLSANCGFWTNKNQSKFWKKNVNWAGSFCKVNQKFIKIFRAKFSAYHATKDFGSQRWVFFGFIFSSIAIKSKWKEFYNYIYRNCKSFNLYHITPSLKMKAMGYNFFNLRTNPI